MASFRTTEFAILILGITWLSSISAAENATSAAVTRILSGCRKSDPAFDECMIKALNKLRPFFKTGIPEWNVPSFDPHYAPEIIQKRGGQNANYELKLSNVSEHGWTNSEITKYRTDWVNHAMVYSQYFPLKWLEGNYDMRAVVLGGIVKRTGTWKLTLKNYSQTTVAKCEKVGEQPKINVTIDNIGDMDLHISNLLQGRSVMENILDRIINIAWRPGFAIVRPLIDEIVSIAFTDIWNEPFRSFPFEDLIPE